MGNSKSTIPQPHQDQIVSYYIPASYRDSEYENCFEITNLLFVKKQIKDIKTEQLVKSTCTDNSRISVDETKRKSLAAKNVLLVVDVVSNVYKDNASKTNEFITINPFFEYIEYQEGGFFARHTDKDKPNANATVLIYPPQVIEGGELAVSLGGYKGTKLIKPLPDKWTIVVFPNKTPHESNMVTNGTKIVLKGTAFINYENPMNQRIWDSRAGLED